MSLLTVIFSPSFCQESVFRPGDRIIVKDIAFLKNSPRPTSPILAVLERNTPAHVIASQTIWVRVKSIDGKSQGWAKATEFEIESQGSSRDTLSNTVGLNVVTRDTFQKREQAVPNSPLLQKTLERKSRQQFEIWGLIIASLLSTFLGAFLVILYQQKNQKHQPHTKNHGEMLRKFNELMIAYKSIEMTHQKLVQNVQSNVSEHWQLLFEELGDAFQQMAALQKQSLDEIEYMLQEIDFLKKEPENL